MNAKNPAIFTPNVESEKFIYLVMPVPGTPIFDYCIKNKHLPMDYNPDRFQWTKANLKNTEIGPQELEAIRDYAWETCNKKEFKDLRKSWIVDN